MFYSFDLVIPANTPAAAPLALDVDLAGGLVHHVELQFPRGCVGLVHVRVFHLSHQVYPANPGGDIAGDGSLIGWGEELELRGELTTLRLQGWNLDDTFAHTVTFRFALTPARGGEGASVLTPPPFPVLGTLELP